MSLRIIPYFRGSELKNIIENIKSRFVNSEKFEIKFIVPSRKDREWWRERAGGDFYGFLNSWDEIPWTWQELYEDICRFIKKEPRSVISPPDHLLILKNILQDILKEKPEISDLWPGVKRPGFIEILSDDIHELLNEAVKPEQLSAPESEISGDNTAVSKILHKAYHEYLKYLSENSLMDSAQIWTNAADILSANKINKSDKNFKWGENYILVFTGFMSFTSGQLELVKLLKNICRELIIIRPEARLKNFRDAAAQLIDDVNLNINIYDDYDSKDDKNNKKLNCKIIELPSAEAGLEPEAMARNLSLWADNKGEFIKYAPFPGFDAIGISAPSGMEDALEQAMRRYRVPYYFNKGVSISRTLPGRILSSIRGLNNLLFPAYATAMLLTQPCFAGNDFSVFRAFRFGASGLEKWREYLEDGEKNDAKNDENKTAFLAIKSIEKFCGAIKTGGTPEELMSAFYEFLTTKGLWLDKMRTYNIGAEFDETLRLTSSAIDTINDKILALHENMPNIGGVREKILKDGDAFDFLEMWCRESFTYPPEKLNGAVSVYSGQPPVLASYPVWIMLNVTQRIWPGRIQSSPLLDASEHEIIAQNGGYLPNIQDKAIQREALFRRLILTGENLTIISRPEVDEDNRPLSESPFMRRFIDDIRGTEKINLNPSSIKILTGGEYIFNEIEPEPDIFYKNSVPIINDLNIKSLGASDLGSLLMCPFLWWLNNKAAINERKMELATPAQWGLLAHAMWENIWRKFKVLNVLNENAKDPEKLFIKLTNKELENFLLLKDKSGENLSGDIYAEYKRFASDFRLRRGLENFKFRFLRLGNFQARILGRMYRSGFRHCDIWLEDEARLKISPEPRFDFLGDIYFSGQCDRIEIIADNNGEKFAVITDYKRGRSENYELKTSVNLAGILDKNLYKSLEFPKLFSDDGKYEFKFGLQLSAYALMFAQQYPEIKLAAVNFLGLEDGKAAGTFDENIKFLFEDIDDNFKPRKNKAPDALNEREDEALFALKCARKILNAGRFAPDYSSKWCKMCGMKGICRRGEFVGENLLEDFNNSSETGDVETA